MTRLQGGNHNDGIQKTKKDFLRVFIMDQKMWIGAQLINFYFVPVHYQIIVVSFVNVIFGAYLSFVQNH